MDACEGEEIFGYLIELYWTYFFKDDGWDTAGESGSFKVIKGLSGGGNFYLTISDTLPDNVGVVESWGVGVKMNDQEMVVDTVFRFPRSME